MALISHGLWKRRLGSDPAAIGKKILIDSKPHTVVGVLPPEMQSLGPIDIWVPTALDRNSPRGDHIVGVMARLKPGVSLISAQAEMEVLVRRITEKSQLSGDVLGVRVIPIARFYTGPIAPALVLLQLAVGLLLLIACANVASLLMARAVNRKQEISLRLALGANRLRLIRQLLTESVLLGLLGGGLGLLLAGWGISALRSVLPDIIPRLKSMSIDLNVMIFTTSLSLLTGLLFGLVPAWKAARLNLADQLKAGADKLAGNISGQRSRSLLLVAEIAMTLVLSISAGLLVKSFWKLLTVPPGFRPDHLLTMTLNLPDSKYRDPIRCREFMQSLLHRLETLPGAQSAAAVSVLPMRGSFMNMRINVAAFAIEGHPKATAGREPNADYRFVTPGYFETMGIPVLQGRGFTEMDGPVRPRVIMINQAMARLHFPAENPIGKKVRFMPVTSDPYEIVGVAGDVHLGSLAAAVEPAVYLSFPQQPRLTMSITIRSLGIPKCWQVWYAKKSWKWMGNCPFPSCRAWSE